MALEFDGQGLLIDRLQETVAKLAVDGHGAADDAVGPWVADHDWARPLGLVPMSWKAAEIGRILASNRICGITLLRIGDDCQVSAQSPFRHTVAGTNCR